MEQIYDFLASTDYTYPATITISGGDVTLAPISAPSTYTENFNDAVGLTFGAEIEISGGVQAQLVLENDVGHTFNEDFADDTGHTYNASNTEFTGGLVQQVSQNYKSNYYEGLIYVSYDTSINADYGTAPLTGNAVGTPTLSASKVACLGGGNNAVYYQNNGIDDADEYVTVIIKYTPNYSGSPVANRNIFELGNGTDNNSKVLLMHGATGALRASIYNSAGVAQWTAYSFSAFNPTAGTEYEIMFTLDTFGATIKCFVGGVSYGSNTIASFTRGANANRLYVGAGTIYSSADGYFQDVILHDYVLPGPYTPAPYGTVLEGTFYASYTSTINGSWGDGVLTGTAVGGASISGGKLDLIGGGLQYVDYAGLNNASLMADRGCIRFKYTPNYSGTPVADRDLICISESNVSTNNLIVIRHRTTNGTLALVIYSSVSTGILGLVEMGVFGPVAGTEYEIELNFDTGKGETRLFVDGNQSGATQVQTGTRTNAIGLIRIGSNIPLTNNPDGEIDDVLLFAHPQHTANYVPDWSNIGEYRYLPDVITLPNFVYSGPGNIQAFSGFSTVETNAPRYILNGEYWNGGAWAASSDTWATASPAADVTANIATLTPADTVTVKIITNGSLATLQQVDDLSLNYTGQTYPTTNPTIDIDTAVESASPPDPVASWNSFAATITAAGGDAVTFSLSDDAGVTYYYWTGAAWAPSAGYAQTNDFATINTNIASFPKTADGMTIKVYLHSNDGSTTPNVGNLDVGFTDSGFSLTNPKITANATLAVEGSILNFFTLETVSGTDSITYTISVDGTEMYWDGSAWSASSGYPQTNTASQIDTNISSLTLTGKVTVRVYAYLHSTTGLSTPTLSNVTLNYDQASIISESYDFATITDYDYDESFIEIVSGVAQLKRLIPTDAVLYLPYTSSLNEVWYDLVGTSVGGAAINSAKLDLTGGVVKYVDYTLPTSSATNTGSFQVAVTPNYTGFPVAERVYGCACKADSDTTNLIQIKHKMDGNLHLEIRSATDVAIIDQNIGVWLPTSGQEYIFELSYDILSGVTNFFIDGSQLGTTITLTGSRSTDVTLFRMGSNSDGTATSDYSARYFSAFNLPQNTGNYSAQISDLDYSEEIYTTTNPYLTLYQAIEAAEFHSFSSTITATGLDEIRFALNVNGTLNYWNGTSWGKSDGYSESNTAAEISQNIYSLVLPSTGLEVFPVIYFHSDIQGLTTPSISLFSLSYEHQAPLDTPPSKCVVSGYLLNALNQPLASATVEIRPSRSFDISNKNLTVVRQWVSTTTDSNGYFESSLIASSEADGDPVFYDFKITSGTDVTYLRNKTIPASSSVKLNEL